MKKDFDKKTIIILISITIIVLLSYLLSNNENQIISSILLTMFIILLSILFFVLIIKILDNKERNKKDSNFGVELIDRIMYLIFFLLIISPMFVYLISLLATSFEDFFTPVATIDAWLSFSGSLIGGSLVLIALAFTLSHEQKRREEDLVNQFLPILMINVSRNRAKQHDKTNKHIGFSQHDRVFIIIENAYKNPIRDLRIIKSTLKFYDTAKNTLNNNYGEFDIVFKTTQKNLIAPYNSYSTWINLNHENMKIDPRTTVAVLEVELLYFDVYKKNSHKHISKIHFNYINNEKYFLLEHYLTTNDYIYANSN